MDIIKLIQPLFEEGAKFLRRSPTVHANAPLLQSYFIWVYHRGYDFRLNYLFLKHFDFILSIVAPKNFDFEEYRGYDTLELLLDSLDELKSYDENHPEFDFVARKAAKLAIASCLKYYCVTKKRNREF